MIVVDMLGFILRWITFEGQSLQLNLAKTIFFLYIIVLLYFHLLFNANTIQDKASLNPSVGMYTFRMLYIYICNINLILLSSK